MIVLDAYAVLALLKGEEAVRAVAELLESPEETALTVLGVAEVLDHLVRLVGADADDAALDLAQLGLANPEPLAADIAMRAGLMRARHYHRSHRAVSLADCVAAETARTRAAPVATSDPHLLDMCTVEAIAVRVLPDTAGNSWSP
ncbi:MAG: PIN domain-containing protein [Pseudonocardiaceae bacterium]